MLKCLLIVCAVFVFQIVPLKVGGITQTENHDQKASSKQASESQSSFIYNVDNRHGGNETANKNAIPEDDTSKYIRRGFWINLALAAITLCLAIAAVVQAMITNRQAKHIVNSERAWLSIYPVNEGETLNPGYSPLFFWEIKNIGKTPAKIIDTQAMCEVSEDYVPLSEEPRYRPSVPFGKRLLGPGDTFRFNTYWTLTGDDTFAPVKRSMGSFDVLILRAYGFVRYHSVFSEDGQPYESRFCDDFIFTSKAEATTTKDRTIVFHPLVNAPPAYTQHT